MGGGDKGGGGGSGSVCSVRPLCLIYMRRSCATAAAAAPTVHSTQCGLVTKFLLRLRLNWASNELARHIVFAGERWLMMMSAQGALGLGLIISERGISIIYLLAKVIGSNDWMQPILFELKV